MLFGGVQQTNPPARSTCHMVNSPQQALRAHLCCRGIVVVAAGCGHLPMVVRIVLRPCKMTHIGQMGRAGRLVKVGVFTAKSCCCCGCCACMQLLQWVHACCFCWHKPHSGHSLSPMPSVAEASGSCRHSSITHDMQALLLCLHHNTLSERHSQSSCFATLALGGPQHMLGSL